MCVYLDFRGCGYAIVAAQSEEAGIDGGCVLKEGWCTAPVF